MANLRQYNWDPAPPRRGGPRSLFWPVVLIVIGAVFLLQNLGFLVGDAGDLLLRLWPLILILVGIDNLLDRSGIVAPVFLIGLGVIFLLSILGYLALDIWQVIFTLWPILLIAWGFDVMVGRRSWLASLFGVLVVLAILAGAVGVLSGRVAVRGLGGSISRNVHDLNTATSARLDFDIPVGMLRMSAAEPGERELTGSYYSGSGFEVIEDFNIENGVAVYNLRTRGDVVAFPMAGGNFTWEYRVPDGLPLEVTVNQGAGVATLDLAELEVENLSAEIGAGQMRVVLPGETDLTARVSGGVGFITIIVPEGVGVSIRRGVAMAFFTVPDDYVRDGDIYRSPGYEDAAVQIDLDVSLGMGGVQVRQ